MERSAVIEYDVALVGPDACEGDPEFYLLGLADNLLLTRDLRVPGMILVRLPTSSLGSDGCAVLNAVLEHRQFVNQLDPTAWVEQMRRARPTVWIECPRVRAANAESAVAFGVEAIQQMLNLMAISRDTAPRLVAVVVGQHVGGGRKEIVGFRIEDGIYRGNLAGGILAGEDQCDLLARWSSLQSNTRAQLWVSLYKDAVRENRWDYKLFRCYGLLEALGSVLLGEEPIYDASGNPRLMHNGCPYTTKQSRGKVYALLLLVAKAINQYPGSFGTQKPTEQPGEDQLWDELEIWVCMRNVVAHEGAWQPPRPNEKSTITRVRAAIQNRAYDNTFEAGALAEAYAVQATLRTTLLAIIEGKLTAC